MLLYPSLWVNIPTWFNIFIYNKKIIFQGLHAEADSILKIGSEAALCFVDIDKPLLQLPEEIPVFPHKVAFVQELQAVLDKHQVVCYQDEGSGGGGGHQQNVQSQFVGPSAKLGQNDVMTASCTLPSGIYICCSFEVKLLWHIYI